MFTGLIQALGTLASRQGGRLTIRADFAPDLAIGESVAINGVCLTVVSRTTTDFAVDVSPTTFALTSAGSWQPGDKLNLERALALGDRLGGHIVSGHVDGVGKLLRKEPLGNSTKLWFEISAALAATCIPLGSIAVDGVSLTLNEVEGKSFSVTIIPQTARKTTLGSLSPGAAINLETDVIGKYVQRLVDPYLPKHEQKMTSEGISWSKLAEAGFVSQT
ncbi:MAG: riboflavin synthase [Candidatus Sericytochromatia bacterium]|uniref:Riboflavin synthase n=1 Tax=Candidatus Tanganyikabacteria bacterium TaxID=2961651 RepID=A0A937X7A3_9BACT|nr:riboflavin synthase [Candidatus Tanganyikabacteria bacterium]